MSTHLKKHTQMSDVHHEHVCTVHLDGGLIDPHVQNAT
jgi:hypothetical protein